TDRFDGVPANSYVSRIEPSHFSMDRFYVTFDNHRTNDFTPYVYVTDNGGESFRSIASDLPTGSVDFVHVIREDKRNENLLFVGTDVGVYVSTNRGASWQRFMEGLPAVPVHDLQIHPRDRELIAGTHGRSIWIVDIAPLQDMTDQVMADGVALFEPKPAFQFGTPPRGGEFYAQSYFQRPTPGSNAEISYFIGEELAAELQAAFDESRPQRGGERQQAQQGAQRPAMAQGPSGARPGAARGPQVEITVTDAAGEAVSTIQGPAEAGIHKVRWNYRGPAPEAAEPGPYRTKEREELSARAKVVGDSLIEAGWDENTVRRLTGPYTGEMSQAAFMRSFTGGGGQGRDPEEFQERPAEQMGGGSRGSFGQMREVAELIAPDMGFRALRAMFRSGGGQAPLMDPGIYTITLKAGERTFTQTLVVERVGTFAVSPAG
ncbi:MAG: hypothetical protein JSW51_07775, partial [Gemmatimonadota bacterium]